MAPRSQEFAPMTLWRLPRFVIAAIVLFLFLRVSSAVFTHDDFSI